MSYVDEVIELVVKKNPAEPEFHQAVKEVLESLRVVVEANEEKFRKDALLERLVEPERQFKFNRQICCPCRRGADRSDERAKRQEHYRQARRRTLRTV